MITIVGKQKIEPPKLEGITIGLNEAAIWYNTTYAMTGHYAIYEHLKAENKRIPKCSQAFV